MIRMKRPNSESTPTEVRYVSTAQVAVALGVSVTTVKRWVDDGVLPAHRTPGGHRKLLLHDVVRCVRDGNLPQGDMTSLLPAAAKWNAATPDDFRATFLAAVPTGDTSAIRHAIVGAHRAGLPMEAVADQIISPGMVHLGALWADGDVDVEHEHRISQAVVSALYEIKTELERNAESQRPVALGGAPEHDHASTPSLLARLVLLESGWDAIDLGPHTPTSALAKGITEHKPRLVWVTVTHLQDMEKFVRDHSAFFEIAEDAGVAVALGGRGLTDELRRRLPYTTYGDGLGHLASFARTLHRRPQRPKRGRPPTRSATKVLQAVN
jgi:MerR family transcriptional regulator, light-induced transcriptional regulator